MYPSSEYAKFFSSEIASVGKSVAAAKGLGHHTLLARLPRIKGTPMQTPLLSRRRFMQAGAASVLTAASWCVAQEPAGQQPQPVQPPASMQQGVQEALPPPPPQVKVKATNLTEKVQAPTDADKVTGKLPPMFAQSTPG